MTRTQQELLEFLRRVAAFLDDNGIVFYLFGGTAIGALRHRGFIPWDDDIDILVDRDNYYKLIEASPSLPDDIEFDCFELNHNYAKPYGMFSLKTDTATSRSRIYWGGICMGSPIDVFVTDEVPEDKLDDHTKNLFLYQETMVDAWLYKTDIAKYKDEYFALMKRREQIGKPALMKELKEKLEQYSYDESDRRVVRCSGGSPVRKYLKEWIGEPVYCDFEGLRMPLQTWPEACLRMQYGYNWYLIPKTEDQTHHVQITNYDISYNNYYKDISRFIDWDKAAEINRKRKMADIGRLDSWLAIENFNDEITANAMILRADPSANDEIAASYSRGYFKAVTERLSDLSDNFKLIIKSGCGKGRIDDVTLRIWIECLVREGRYWDAIKAGKAFCDDTADGALADTLDLLGKVTLMAEHWQDHKEKECKEALEAVPEEMRYKIPDCLVAANWLRQKGCMECDRNALAAYCREYLESFPDNYDIMKVLGDLLIERGDTAAGEELYRKVLGESRNGLDLLYINDYFEAAEN